MSRYIDAEKLKADIKEVADITDGKLTEFEVLGILSGQQTSDVVEADKAQKEIDYWHDKAQSYEQTILKLSLNKADVVEVVRCKDCKWYHEIGCAIKIVDESDEPKDNDYCSFGERADT